MPKTIIHYPQSRGMDLMTDVRDWLGGWPTEFSSVQEVTSFAEKELGLTLANLSTGEGNSEFLLGDRAGLEQLGYKPYTPVLLLDDSNDLPTQPVWIFGAPRGGGLIFDYLTKRDVTVEGFIDLEPAQLTMKNRPITKLVDFMKAQPKSTTIILANRFSKENAVRLRQAGFEELFDAHNLVMRLLRG